MSERKRPAILAVEDAVAQAAGTKICAACGVQVATVVGLYGRGYLKSRANELNRSAATLPVIMFVDQDRQCDCPPRLRERWFSGPLSPSFFFFVLVMELEAWLLADRSAFASFLHVPDNKLPAVADQVAQPKELVIQLACRSHSRTIREDLVPAAGSTASVGPLYSPRLVGWINNHWNPRRAAQCSGSLARTLRKLGG